MGNLRQGLGQFEHRLGAQFFWDFERQSHSFEAMAIFDSAGRGYNLSAVGARPHGEQVSGLRVSADTEMMSVIRACLGKCGSTMAVIPAGKPAESAPWL